MKKLIVGIPTSLILMMSSCTATLQEFQDRNNNDEDVEEVADEQTDEEVEETEDSEDENEDITLDEESEEKENTEDESDVDSDETDEESDKDADEESEETPEDEDSEKDADEESEETPEDEESEKDADEESEETPEDEESDKDAESEESSTDSMDELPEEVIQEFVRVNERVETLENRLSTLERHLNEAEDEISRIYDSLGNRATPREGEEVDAEEREEIEVFDTSDGRGSRSEPFDVGDTVAIEVFEYSNGFTRLFGTAEITIDNIIMGDDAFEILQEESRFNSEAPEGYEWAIISLSFYLADFEDDDVSIGVTDSISIVSDTGSTPPNDYALPPNPLTYTEVFSGGEVQGNVAKLIPIDEPFLIYFDSFKTEDLFFKYEEE